MVIDLNRVGFHIKLDNNYKKEIRTAMELEMTVAQKKWGVKLDDSIQAHIIEHALEQLDQKVSDTSKSSWNFQDTLTIKIKGLSKKGQRDLQLPKDQNYSKMKNKNFIMTRDGWEVTDDASDASIKLIDFPEYVFNKIIEWSRTAVFYGVGSYKI